MLEISVRLLAGRYHATPWDRHPREGEPEWPLSPWRLARALAASYYRTPEQFELASVEELVRILAVAPEFHLPEASAGHTRQYFPQANPGNKQLLFDGFVRTDDVIVLRWPELSLSARQLELLQRLLQGVSYLGRAESWAELSVSEHESPLPSNCSLRSQENTEPVRLLGVDPQVTWKQLTVQTSQLQKEGWSSPPGSCWLTYHRPTACFQTRGTGRIPSLSPVAVRYSYLRPVRPRLANALFAAESWRTDFLRQLGPALLPIFSGKSPDGSVCQRSHSHPYILPLPAPGQPHMLGELIVFRKTPPGEVAFPDEVREILARKIGATQIRENRTFRIHFLEFLEAEQLVTLAPFRASQCWQSQTPFVPTRHIKPGKEELLDQIRRELANHGGPAELLVSIEDAGPMIGGVALREFKTNRQNRPKRVPGAHNLRLHFREPVAGPMVLGYGAHFGLGQFRPIDRSRPIVFP